MLYNNREYPHPVLGVGDAVNGEFKTHLNVKAGKQTIKIEPVFELDNKDLNSLIEEGKAVFVTQIYCRATMFREMIKSDTSVAKPIVIPTPKLREQVEVDFFVCANENIPEYTNSASHPDYSGFSFPVEKGELLAYSGKGIFNANKTPEELKAISAFMNIDKYEKENGPIYNFYDGSKITIRLPENDYMKYQQIVSNPFVANIVHGAVVLPALMDAVNEIQSGSGEFSDKDWYRILGEMVNDAKQENLLKIGQKILDNPVNRAFNTIQKMIEYED